MKKLILLSAMALGLATASAQSFGDYYTVTYEGKTIENGALISSDAYDDYAGWYHCDIQFVPKKSYSSVRFNVKSDYTDNPSFEMQQSDIIAWGTPSVCWASGMNGGCEDNRPPMVTNFNVGAGCDGLHQINYEAPFVIQFHVLGADNYDSFDPADPSTWTIKPTKTSNYTVTVAATIDGETVPESFKVNILIGPDAAYVDGITADDDTPAVYYDLTGRAVAHPEKGQIVIERKGGKTVKMIYSK